MPKPGDVYFRQTEDGRYTAVRVLEVEGKESYVSTTPYLDDEPPSLDHPQLREVVIKNRFSFANEPAILWLTGKPDKSFQYLGNVPLTGDEPKPRRVSYGGKWSGDRGDDSYMEWRWEHDRPAFEAEVRQKREDAKHARNQSQKPKRMMSEKRFWSIIDRLDWKQQGDDRRVLEPAIEALAKLPPKEICMFEERFAYLLYQLDTRAHGNQVRDEPACGEEGYLSADGFLYARCIAVANGQSTFKKILKDPTQLPKEMEFEALLGLAPTAYERSTGDSFDYGTGCSYESFSNAAGWSL